MQIVTVTIAEVVVLLFSATLLWIFYADPFGSKAIETIVWQISHKPADAIGFFFMPVISLAIMLPALFARRSNAGIYWFLVLTALILMSVATSYLLLVGDGLVPAMFLIVPLAYLAAVRARR